MKEKYSYYRPFTVNHLMFLALFALGFVVLQRFVVLFTMIYRHEDQGDILSLMRYCLLTLAVFILYFMLVQWQGRRNACRPWNLGQRCSKDGIELIYKKKVVASWNWEDIEVSFLSTGLGVTTGRICISTSFKNKGNEKVFDEGIKFSSDYFFTNDFKTEDAAINFLSMRFRCSKRYRELFELNLMGVSSLSDEHNNDKVQYVYEKAIELADSERKINNFILSVDGMMDSMVVVAELLFIILIFLYSASSIVTNILSLF